MNTPKRRVVPMVVFKRQLGAHVNRAVYGEYRIIATYHGQPHCVLMGVGELEGLEDTIVDLKDKIDALNHVVAMYQEALPAQEKERIDGRRQAKDNTAANGEKDTL